MFGSKPWNWYAPFACVMKERTCSVLAFLICTTAPAIGSPCASVTAPCTMRSFSSSLSFLSNARIADAKQVKNRANIIALRVTVILSFYGRSLPILFLLVFLFVLVVAGVGVFFFFFFQVDFGLKFERADADDLQVGATLVAAQRIALIDVIFVYVNFGVAFGAKHHKQSSLIPRLYEKKSMVAKCKISSARLFRQPAPCRARDDSLEPQVHEHLRPMRQLVLLNELQHLEPCHALAVEPGDDSGEEILALGRQSRRLHLDRLPQLRGERGRVKLFRQLQL